MTCAAPTGGSPVPGSSKWRGAFALGLGPLALYALVFYVFTFPLLGRFSTHFFADAGDGLQNVWNLWWFETALTRLGTSPWFTTWLHFPHGTTLLGHTLGPFNGLLALLLEPWLGLVRAHNTLVIFSFVAGAWTAFLLALHVSGRWLASLIAGFVFGFSSYHFAHAQGHLNLLSLEWIPVFLLAWLRLLGRPSPAAALGASLALLLVLLCDYYYFLYCVLAGALVLGVEALRRRDWCFALRQPLLGRLAVFVGASAVTSGPLVVALLFRHSRDSFTGEHRATNFSLDLLALWIPGICWRFHAWTEAYWSRLPATIESSVSLGFGATLAVLLATSRRVRGQVEGLSVWWAFLLFFGAMSLGPVLQIWGRIQPVPLPYLALELLLPPLRVSGVPVRMVVMVTLSAGILGGLALDALLRRGRLARAGALLILACMVFEMLPKPIPTTDSREIPGWVAPLAALSKQYGFMDVADAIPVGEALYLQTLHEVPMFEGYISRVPTSVFLKNRALRELRRRRDFEVLCREHAFAYFLLREGTSYGAMPVDPVWRGEGLELYDVRAAWTCAAPPGMRHTAARFDSQEVRCGPCSKSP